MLSKVYRLIQDHLKQTGLLETTLIKADSHRGSLMVATEEDVYPIARWVQEKWVIDREGLAGIHAEALEGKVRELLAAASSVTTAIQSANEAMAPPGR